jgi:4-hydroxy-4-methyl-2-oxoglutarate aldolase
VVVSPGDVVCADDDGVVAVPRAEAGWAVERSRERVAREDAVRARLAAGELGVDVYGLRAELEALGVEYVE